MLEHADPFVPMTEASENFAGVTQLVDRTGLAVILKNDKPRYVVLDFDAYDALQEAREARRNTVDTLADQLIADNLTAFQALAE